MSNPIRKLGPDSHLYENINENVQHLQRRNYIYDNTKVWDFFLFFLTILEQSELVFTEMRVIPLKSLKPPEAEA